MSFKQTPSSLECNICVTSESFVDFTYNNRYLVSQIDSQYLQTSNIYSNSTFEQHVLDLFISHEIRFQSLQNQRQMTIRITLCEISKWQMNDIYRNFI